MFLTPLGTRQRFLRVQSRSVGWASLQLYHNFVAFCVQPVSLALPFWHQHSVSIKIRKTFRANCFSVCSSSSRVRPPNSLTWFIWYITYTSKGYSSHIECVTQTLTQNSAELCLLQCRSGVLVGSQELLSISFKTPVLHAPKKCHSSKGQCYAG